jgi:hypothetical protein
MNFEYPEAVGGKPNQFNYLRAGEVLLPTIFLVFCKFFFCGFVFTRNRAA